MSTTRAFAHTNIALIKYWGKLPGNLNLSATGSLSLTLDGFGTETELSFIDNPQDIFILNNQKKHGEALARVQKFLDLVRLLAKQDQRCLVRSQNHVPTQSGLASSASGFAALAVAANHLFNLSLNNLELSKLARMGSGSAARSIFGEFVYMHAGCSKDQSGGYAESIIKHPALDVRLIVVQCADQEKSISSREGMNLTAQTSPYYPAWVATHAQDLKCAMDAVLSGDLQRLGELTEHSTLKMHATMLAAKPWFSYIEPLTLIVMNRVKKLRDHGATCYFTMDAGPHVKVLCKANEANAIAKDLRQIPDIIQIDIVAPGKGAYLL